MSERTVHAKAREGIIRHRFAGVDEFGFKRTFEGFTVGGFSGSRVYLIGWLEIGGQLVKHSEIAKKAQIIGQEVMVSFGGEKIAVADIVEAA